MYRSITVLVPEELADDASALLIEHGADGVEVEDASVRLMPGRAPPPSGQARLIGYFSPESVDPALANSLADLVEAPVAIASEELPDKDWNEVWKSHFAPIEVSPRLWVCPSWRLGETPAAAKVLVLDPGMAFGTGTHATTSLCMVAVDAFLVARPGASVLDVGTGSGILAIAARLLGSGTTVGIDNDNTAIRVARENADKNHVTLDFSTKSLDETGGPYDLVVANIMSGTLIELAVRLAGKVAAGGELLLSGILDFQADEVAAAFVERQLHEIDRKVQGEWVLLRFGR